MRKTTKLLCALLAFTMLFTTLPMVMAEETTQYTEGNYTYTVQNDQATIVQGNLAMSGDIIIPEILGGYPVIAIASNAFWNCTRITAITVPGTIKTVGSWAFQYCTKAATITFLDGVASIGNFSLSGNESLKTVYISASVTTIGEGILNNTSSLDAIYYTGSESQWQQINFGADNNELDDVAIYYNCTIPEPKPEPTPTPDTPKGDITGDGKINSADALIALKFAVGKQTLTDEQFAMADLDKDEKVNSADALMMLKIAVGKLVL